MIETRGSQNFFVDLLPEEIQQLERTAIFYVLYLKEKPAIESTV